MNRRLPLPTLAWCAAIFALAFLLRFLVVLLWPTMAHEDEIFQSVEQAHRLVFGYGVVPWEFEYGSRSWLLAYVSAGLIRFSMLFGEGPAVYLTVIGAAFSLLSSTGAVCTFLWARRHFGDALALVAALVPLCWVDGLFYGPRSMAEPVSVNLLILGLYLAFPGFAVRSRPRLVLAGALLAACAVIRLQLLPAVLLAWLWGREDWRLRAACLTAGAALVLALNGWFDAVTWSWPFEPIWRNFVFNTIEGGSSAFGTKAWWWYIYNYAGAWGGTFAVFLGLAAVGARKLPLLFIMALVIAVSHSLIPHKEARFLYPAVALLAVCAGFGLVQVGLWLRDGLAAQGRTMRTRQVFSALCAAWLVLSAINVFGLDYREYWDERQHERLQITADLSRDPALCGIGLQDMGLLRAGGYSYLHRRVPIYELSGRATVSDLARAAPDFNVVVFNQFALGNVARMPPQAGYRPAFCRGDYCVLRRPGGCRSTPMKKTSTAPEGFALGPARYPQRQGVTD